MKNKINQKLEDIVELKFIDNIIEVHFKEPMIFSTSDILEIKVEEIIINGMVMKCLKKKKRG